MLIVEKLDMKAKNIFRIAALMVAGTIGAGIFGLPYIFSVSGWLIAGIYLVVFTAILAWVHAFYARALVATEERHRLLGLVERFYGAAMHPVAAFIILGGLSLILVVYLVLAEHFFNLFAPGRGIAAVTIFWLAASVPAMLAIRRTAAAEMFGTSAIAILIIGIFLEGLGRHGAELPAWNTSRILLPFAPILFALAGWATLESATEYGRRKGFSVREMAAGIATGGAFTVILYGLFVSGILRFAPAITPDTITGLSGLPLQDVLPVAALGVFALWVSYVIIAFEIKKSCRADLGLSGFMSAAIPFFLPPMLFLLGVRDFLSIIGLVGGVFLALQYAFIISVSKKVLRPSPVKKFLLDALVIVFLLAAIYEIYHFVVG